MTDHSAVVQGFAAGVGGAVLALLGVDAQTLTLALIGSALGARFARAESSRARAAMVFMAAVCASAVTASVLGPVLAAWLPGIDQDKWTRLLAIAVGALLHPAIQAGAEVPAAVVKATVKRWGGGT